MDLRGEVRHGVVDFIKVFYWPDKPWPTFNVADVALVVGVGLLFIFLTRHGETIDASKREAAAPIPADEPEPAAEPAPVDAPAAPAPAEA
jgi:signal peptidase II